MGAVRGSLAGVGASGGGGGGSGNDAKAGAAGAGGGDGVTTGCSIGNCGGIVVGAGRRSASRSGGVATGTSATVGEAAGAGRNTNWTPVGSVAESLMLLCTSSVIRASAAACSSTDSTTIPLGAVGGGWRDLPRRATAVSRCSIGCMGSQDWSRFVAYRQPRVWPAAWSTNMCESMPISRRVADPGTCLHSRVAGSASSRVAAIRRQDAAIRHAAQPGHGVGSLYGRRYGATVVGLWGHHAVSVPMLLRPLVPAQERVTGDAAIIIGYTAFRRE